MKTLRMFMVLFLIVLAGGLASGQQSYVHQDYDTAPVLRAYNNGGDDITVITRKAGMTNLVVIGAVTNWIINSGTGTNDTLTLLADSLGDVTNASGVKVLSVIDQNCGLAADSIDDEMLNGTNYILARSWGVPFIWDTSVCKFYSCYFPRASRGGIGGQRVIEKINGAMLGTGYGAVSVYVNRSRAFYRVQKPEYIYPSSLNMTGVVSMTAQNINLDLSPRIPVGENYDILVRGVMETTATTGAIGAVFTLR